MTIADGVEAAGVKVGPHRNRVARAVVTNHFNKRANSDSRNRRRQTLPLPHRAALDLSMNRKAKVSVGVLVVIGVLLGAYHVVTRISVGSDLRSGTRIDELNGVAIIYNGGANESHGRNQTADGYNLGIRYQCVEFVKRYYFERFGHRMPDSYGHAKTFFDRSLADGALNETRGLLQFRNGSSTGPASDDIVIFGPSLLNPYGHVAVIAQVNSYAIVIAQQNAGPVHSSRESIPLAQQDGGYHVKNDRVLGWLRLPDSSSRSLHPDALTGGG